MSNLIVEIRPGEGGIDAKVFARDLSDVLQKLSRRHGWGMQSSISADARIIHFIFTGVQCECLHRITGTHRIQRIPKNDTRGRRHTSTASLVVLEEKNTKFVPLTEKDTDLEVSFFKGSGPGGQHRNKTESGVRVLHKPSGVMVTIDHGRSQASNRIRALNILNQKLSQENSGAHVADLNQKRVGQVTSSGRSAKTFTHNTQRSTVVDHERGKTWSWEKFYAGKLGCKDID